SSSVKVIDCTFKNLVGNGIIVDGGQATVPSHLEVGWNRFYEYHGRKNRIGVEVMRGNDVWIHDNDFLGMGRKSQPGAVNLETGGLTNNTPDKLIDVHVTGNLIVGTAD